MKHHHAPVDNAGHSKRIIKFSIDTFIALLTIFLMTESRAEAGSYKNFPLPIQSSTSQRTASAKPDLHQKCALGHYSGPEAGKGKYTRDRFTWVVTPDFAQLYCMPQSFVSADLSGASAIAYRLASDEDEQQCVDTTLGPLCRSAKEHRLEVYVSSGALPQARDGRYQNSARIQSALLITEAKNELTARLRELDGSPIPGAASLFDIGQFKLVMHDPQSGRDTELGLMYPRQYYKGLRRGIDLITLTFPLGFSHAMTKKGGVSGYEMQIKISKPKPRQDSAEQLRVVLPSNLAQKIAEEDLHATNELIEAAKPLNK